MERNMCSFNPKNEPGFTLVELAIALMIIGLLVGGILQGQELISQANVTQTIRQIQSYRTAALAFKTIYNALPGDIRNPSARITACSAALCNITGNGNGLIGNASAATTITLGAASASQSSQESGPNAERSNFFIHLVKAGLITGINPDYAAGQTFEWGVQEPASPFEGSGFFAAAYASMTSSLYEPTFFGNMIYLRAEEVNNPALPTHAAAQVDAKLDDGKPFTGDIVVIANGASAATTCVSSQVRTATYTQNATSGGCALFIMLGY